MAIVRVDPDLAAAVLRQERADRSAAPLQGYGIWLLARALDRQGAGWVDRQQLRAICASNGLQGRRFLRWLAAAYAQGYLRGGAGDRVRYRSLLDVSQRFKLVGLDGYPVHVSLLLHSLKKIRAALLGAWFAGKGFDEKKPISQADIRTLTAIAPRSQYAYLRLADSATSVIANIEVDVEVYLTPEEAKFWLNAVRGTLPGAFTVRARGGNGQILYPAYHLPNSYSSRMSKAPRGQRRKIHRTLSGRPLMSQSEICANIQRRYAGTALEADQDLDRWAQREPSRDPASMRMHVYNGRTARSGWGHWVSRSAAASCGRDWRPRLIAAKIAEGLLDTPADLQIAQMPTSPFSLPFKQQETRSGGNG